MRRRLLFEDARSVDLDIGQVGQATDKKNLAPPR